LSGPIDPFKILGIDRQASIEEIRQAYRRAAAKYHPDTGGDVWVFQQIQQAYDELLAERERLVGQPPSPRATPFQSAASAQARASRQQTAQESETPVGTSAYEGGSTARNWLFGKPLKLQDETSYFILANFMDLVMTGILLRNSAVEANPIANYFYQQFGFFGMIGLKIASVALVCVIAQYIASRDLRKAKWLLVGGTLCVAGVVVYSMFLARNQLWY
jgi:curved DNA-binding protein CbpA